MMNFINGKLFSIFLLLLSCQSLLAQTTLKGIITDLMTDSFPDLPSVKEAAYVEELHKVEA